MKPWMVFTLVVAPWIAQAQMGNMWGSGMYPANPACGYQNAVADEATSLRDELNERTRELQEAKAEQRRLKSRVNSLRASASGQRDLFKMTGFDGPMFNSIEQHVNSGTACSDYEGYCDFVGSGGVAAAEDYPEPAWYVAWQSVTAASSPSRAPAADLYEPPPAREPEEPEAPVVIETPPPVRPRPPTVEEEPPPAPRRPAPRRKVCRSGSTQWQGSNPGAFFPHCGPRPGEVRDSVCDVVPEPGSMPKNRNATSCRRYLRSWMDRVNELKDLENQIAELDAKVAELQALAKVSKAELAEAMRERQRQQREGLTEGNCINCQLQAQGGLVQRRSSLWDLAGGIIAAGAQAYSSYKLGQYVAEQNSKLGFQTQQIPLAGHVMSAGWPMIQGGLYGVLGGGGGQGAFGCGGGPFGGGNQMGANGFAGATGFWNPYGVQGGMQATFGFPQGMYGTPPGAGMFNVGMGPGFAPGYGAQFYCPVQPCPIGGGQFGMGGQMGMGGNLGFGGPGGFQGGGYNPFMPGMGVNLGASAGLNMGAPWLAGGAPGMMGYPGIVGGGGMPGFGGGLYGGVGVGGMPGAGFGGMPGAGFGVGVGGMPGGWNPGFGGAPGFGGQFGLGMGGMPGGGFGVGAGGMPGAGGAMMNYQMQQQMMQAQAQQYALLAQQQQQAYQNYLSQQQTLNNLYGELYGLQNRIASAQTQVQSGGYLGFQGSFGPMGYPGYGAPGMPMPGMPMPGNNAVTPQPFPQMGVPAVPSFSR